MKKLFWFCLLAAFIFWGVLFSGAQSKSVSSSKSETVRTAPAPRPQPSRPSETGRSRPAPRVNQPRIIVVQKKVVVRQSYPNYNSGYYGGYNNYYNEVPVAVRSSRTGIKFNLELISKKDRETVRRGVVVVNGGEAGIVDRFDGLIKYIPVQPGENEVLVELEDGRQFSTIVDVNENQVLVVYPRFKPSESGKK
jgi:hypothetical protein